MTWVVLAGAALAVGLVRLFRLVAPAAPDLAAQASRWDQARLRAGRRARAPLSHEGNPTDRLVGWAADQLRVKYGVQISSMEQDLAVTGGRLEAWLAKTTTVTLAGLLAPVALLPLALAVGLAVPATWAVLIGVGLAVLMVVVSVGDLRAASRKSREDFRRGLSIYVDLVAMSMEAGRGHAEALPASAGIGTGWVFTELQDAIDGARYAGITPWEALGALGERYGISELVDLRGTLALAHDDGAKIRGTLVARAATLRGARLADAQGRANTSTESMRHVTVLMAVVVVAYEVFPQVMRLFTSS